MDREKLCKLLMLTQSTNENEALSAMRFANGILRKSGQTWQDVLNVRLKWEPPPPVVNQRPVVNPQAAEIEMMFELVLQYVRDNSELFIRSMAEQYAKRGWLSEKQFGALKKFFDNLKHSQSSGARP